MANIPTYKNRPYTPQQRNAPLRNVRYSPLAFGAGEARELGQFGQAVTNFGRVASQVQRYRRQDQERLAAEKNRAQYNSTVAETNALIAAEYNRYSNNEIDSVEFGKRRTDIISSGSTGFDSPEWQDRFITYNKGKDAQYISQIGANEHKKAFQENANATALKASQSSQELTDFAINMELDAEPVIYGEEGEVITTHELYTMDKVGETAAAFAEARMGKDPTLTPDQALILAQQDTSNQLKGLIKFAAENQNSEKAAMLYGQFSRFMNVEGQELSQLYVQDAAAREARALKPTTDAAYKQGALEAFQEVYNDRGLAAARLSVLAPVATDRPDLFPSVRSLVNGWATAIGADDVNKLQVERAFAITQLETISDNPELSRGERLDAVSKSIDESVISATVKYGLDESAQYDLRQKLGKAAKIGNETIVGVNNWMSRQIETSWLTKGQGVDEELLTSYKYAFSDQDWKNISDYNKNGRYITDEKAYKDMFKAGSGRDADNFFMSYSRFRNEMDEFRENDPNLPINDTNLRAKGLAIASRYAIPESLGGIIRTFTDPRIATKIDYIRSEDQKIKQGQMWSEYERLNQDVITVSTTFTPNLLNVPGAGFSSADLVNFEAQDSLSLYDNLVLGEAIDTSTVEVRPTELAFLTYIMLIEEEQKGNSVKQIIGSSPESYYDQLRDIKFRYYIDKQQNVLDLYLRGNSGY